MAGHNKEKGLMLHLAYVIVIKANKREPPGTRPKSGTNLCNCGSGPFLKWKKFLPTFPRNHSYYITLSITSVPEPIPCTLLPLRSTYLT